jgi:hypothetical protein
VGSFSNVIMLRARLDGDPVFTDLLRHQHERLAQGLAHQDYPFPLLVEKLRPVRLPGYMPLTQVHFTYFMARGSQLSELFVTGRRKDLINRGGEKISCDEVENLIFQLAQVREVSLVAMPDPAFGEKACSTERHPASRRTISMCCGVWPRTRRRPSRLFDCWAKWNARRLSHDGIGRSLTIQPRTPPAGFLTHRWRGAGPHRGRLREPPAQLCRTEGRVGVTRPYLRQSGTRRGDLVAVCVERSVEMLVALLAIWQAGAAYVPLDPISQARLDLILEDAAPRTIITDAALAHRLRRGRSRD